VNEASTLIQSAAHEDANIIFGAVLDEAMGEDVKITVIATGFKQQGSAEYQQQFLEAPKDERETSSGGDGGEGSESGGEDDPLYQDAVKLVVEFGKASTSLLQRRLRIGYGRAAHLIDLMEQDGIVGAADGPKPREVLKRPDWISEIEETTR